MPSIYRRRERRGVLAPAGCASGVPILPPPPFQPEPIGDHGTRVERNWQVMTGVRRAFVVASLGRYLMMAINLAATPIMARLLTPADFGVAVLGGSLLAVAEAIRALGGGAYLVQQKDLTPAQMHTNFTISLIATAILIAALLALGATADGIVRAPRARTISARCGARVPGRTHQLSDLGADEPQPGLRPDRFHHHGDGRGQCRRRIALALLGWGYMSLAWAAALSALAGMGLYLYFWRDWSIFRPRLSEWRSVMGFSIHDSAYGHPVPDRRGGALPHHRPDARCRLGRAVPARGAAGLFSRAGYPGRGRRRGAAGVRPAGARGTGAQGELSQGARPHQRGAMAGARHTHPARGPDRTDRPGRTMAGGGADTADPAGGTSLFLSDAAALPDAGGARRYPRRSGHDPGAGRGHDRPTCRRRTLWARGGGAQQLSSSFPSAACSRSWSCGASSNSVGSNSPPRSPAAPRRRSSRRSGLWR